MPPPYFSGSPMKFQQSCYQVIGHQSKSTRITSLLHSCDCKKMHKKDVFFEMGKPPASPTWEVSLPTPHALIYAISENALSWGKQKSPQQQNLNISYTTPELHISSWHSWLTNVGILRLVSFFITYRFTQTHTHTLTLPIETIFVPPTFSNK